MIFFNRKLYRDYVTTDTKIVIRSICAFLIVLFLFNCGGEPDFQEDVSRSRRPQSPEDEIDESFSRRSNLTECKGTGYTIYTQGDCESFKNIGSGEPVSIDTIPTHSVDILFVIDSSNSMVNFLQGKNIRNKFMSFLPDIQALDWRVLFTNARYYKPKGLFGIFSSKDGLNGGALQLKNSQGEMDRKYLDSTVQDYEDVFFLTFSKGCRCIFAPACIDRCTGTNEQPLKALRSSFLLNQEWIRRKADFIAVILTAGDESKMEKTNAEELVDSIIEEFESVNSDEKRLFVFSIIIQPEDKSCKDVQRGQQGFFKEARYGKTIAQLAQQTGGGNFSICSKDFSAVSKAIVRMTAE